MDWRSGEQSRETPLVSTSVKGQFSRFQKFVKESTNFFGQHLRIFALWIDFSVTIRIFSYQRTQCLILYLIWKPRIMTKFFCDFMYANLSSLRYSPMHCLLSWWLSH